MDLRFISYEVFQILAKVWACCQPLPMQQYLPKFAQKRNFEIPQKIKILVFFQKQKFLHIEEALEYVFSVWIFNSRIFHMLFLLSKNGLCMWISFYPLVENDEFRKVPYVYWLWDFVYMYLTNLGTRLWNPFIHT